MHVQYKVDNGHDAGIHPKWVDKVPHMEKSPIKHVVGKVKRGD